MALRMTEREVNDVSILDLEGKIVLGEESNMLREKVRSLLDSGRKKIILNLDKISFIDSTGLGMLVGVFTSSQSQNARLKLMNLSQKPRDLMQVTKLLTVFEVYDSEQTAITSFEK